MVYYNESKDPWDKPPDALLEKIKKGEMGTRLGRDFTRIHIRSSSIVIFYIQRNKGGRV
jgi:hypothetical protein